MQKIKINWVAALLAFFLAVIVWYTVTGRERVETWVGVRLELKGLPNKYVLLNNLPARLEIRLRGPSGLIRNLTGQDMPLVINLADVTKGKNIIPLSKTDMPFTGAFDVMEIRPSALEAEIDEVIEKQVSVTAVPTNKPPVGISKVAFVPEPGKIILKGPESTVYNIDKIKAQVTLPENISKREFSLPSYISLPAGTEAVPSAVKVNVTVEGKNKHVVLVRSIGTQHVPLPDKVSLNPNSVELKVEIPFGWEVDSEILKSLQAYVVLPDNFTDLDSKQILPVKVKVPKDVKLLEINPKNILLNTK